LPFWDGLFRKQQELSTTVPLNLDVGQASYPDVNYASFASEGYSKNEIVHACIRELATSAASPRYYVQAPSTEGGSVEIESGLLYDLTTKPNPYSDWYSFVERLVTFLMVAGNAYAIKERGRNDQVSAMYLLRPDRVTIVAGDYGAESYIYTVGGTEYGVEGRDMCHLALPNPAGDIYGLSPLQVASRTVNLDLNMTDFAKVYFQNAGVPSGLLKVKRRLTSQEEASTIRSRWRSQFGGINNFHRIAILDDDAEYQPMSNSPKDMELGGLHNLTESRICAVFGVPPILVGANVGLQRSTFSNYREARLAFHSETLEPMIARILRYFNRNLFDEYSGNETLAVDWAAMRAVLDDQAATTTRLTGLFAGGILTLNETREALGFDAVSDGALRRIPSSIFEVAEGQAAPVAVDAAPVEQAHPILAEIKAPRVAPRGRMLARRMIEEREEETDDLAAKVLRHFRGIRNRVDGILGRHMERQTAQTKDYPFGVTDMLPPVETGNMERILEAAYRRVSKRTFGTINDVGIAGTLDWSDKLPTVQRVLTQAPTRATMIHRTTSKAIGRAVGIGLERGYSIEQLARGVPDDKFPGIRSILGETENRSRLIARTEIMRSQNQTTVGFYKEQGFVYVQADDVDGDPDDLYVDPGDPYERTCAERHGKIYTLDEAQNIDDHPNGTLNWVPMPRGYKPEGELGVPSVPVDRSDPLSADFNAAEWKPEVKLGPGVNPDVSKNAVAAIRHTVVNMKGDLGTYVAKHYASNPKSAPRILRRKSRLFNRKHPKTGKPMKAGGFYSSATDAVTISDSAIEWATAHEIGHQMTTAKHFVGMMGKVKANKFLAEVQKAFAAAQKRHSEPYTFVRGGTTFKNPGTVGTVSDYGMSDIHEYMAEGFKWAMVSPSKFKGVDDELLRIMRKYLVKDKPVSVGGR
jgi:HK97 family phage portal protein